MKKIFIILLFTLICIKITFASTLDYLEYPTKFNQEQNKIDKWVTSQKYIKSGIIDWNNFTYSILHSNNENSFILMNLNFEKEFIWELIVQNIKYNYRINNDDIKKDTLEIKWKNFEKIVTKKWYWEIKITLVSSSWNNFILKDVLKDEYNNTIIWNNYEIVVFSQNNKKFDFIDSKVYLYWEYSDEKLTYFENFTKIFVWDLKDKNILNLKKYIKTGNSIFISEDLLKYFNDDFLNNNIVKRWDNDTDYKWRKKLNTRLNNKDYYKYWFWKIYILNEYDFLSWLKLDNYYWNNYLENSFVYLKAIKKHFFIENKYILIYILVFTIGILFIILYSSKKKYYYWTIWWILFWVIIFLIILWVKNYIIRWWNDSEFRIKVNYILNNKYIHTTNIWNLFSTKGWKYSINFKQEDYIKNTLQVYRNQNKVEVNNDWIITIFNEKVLPWEIVNYKYIDFENKSKIYDKEFIYDEKFKNIREFSNFLSWKEDYRNFNKIVWEYDIKGEYNINWEVEFIWVKYKQKYDYKYFLSDNVLEWLEVDIYYKN